LKVARDNPSFAAFGVSVELLITHCRGHGRGRADGVQAGVSPQTAGHTRTGECGFLI
jgi:hypothetical protein